MQNLFIFNETFTNGYLTEFLDFSFLASILSAILVIVSKNPIVSVLCLIALFLSISCYLIVLGLNFIGLSYLLVYVGAVSILFLFILMLINIRISELFSNTSNSLPLGIIIGVCFISIGYQILPYNITSFNRYTINTNDYLRNTSHRNYSDYYELFRTFQQKNDIVYVTGRIWDGNLAETTDISSIGSIMYSSYSMWLILTSMILLLAMVGAIVITIKQKS